MHLPVVVNEAGQKLSKQTLAAPLETAKGGEALVSALLFLGQDPPNELVDASGAEIMMFAVDHWSGPPLCDKKGLLK